MKARKRGAGGRRFGRHLLKAEADTLRGIFAVVAARNPGCHHLTISVSRRAAGKPISLSVSASRTVDGQVILTDDNYPPDEEGEHV